MFCDQFSCIIETLAKLARGSVLGAHTAANRGQRGRCPSHSGGFASTSINCGHVNWGIGPEKNYNFAYQLIGFIK